MAFIISRISTLRGRPPGLAGGINGSILCHCLSVKSLGYSFRVTICRSFAGNLYAILYDKYRLTRNDHFELFTHLLSDAAKKLLLNYTWPGNLRELANAMERAYVLTINREIQPAVLPFKMVVAEPAHYLKQELPTLDEIKRKIIMQTLEFTKGRKPAAAKVLGIEHRKLNRLMEKLNIPQMRKNVGS